MVSTPVQTKNQPLSKKLEYRLIDLAQQGDRRAMNRLVKANLGLVHQGAGRYQSSPIEYDDLVQIGSLAVVTAVEKFDFTKDCRLSTYASIWIRADQYDAAIDSRGITKGMATRLKQIRTASNELIVELGHEPSVAEIADRLEITTKQVLRAWEKQRLGKAPTSLNIKLTEDTDIELLDLQAANTDTWEFTLAEEQCQQIAEHLHKLPERLQQILRAKFLDNMSNPQIGEFLGVCGERARQLLKEALELFHALILGWTSPDAETAIPVSFHHNIESISAPLSPDLPAPEAIREIVMERVDASRLGGRIGKTIKQIFSQMQDDFGSQCKEIISVSEPLLVLDRQRNHGSIDITRHHFSIEYQRFQRLEKTENSWRGYLEFSKKTMVLILLAFEIASQGVRKFQQNRIPNRRRPTMDITATSLIKSFWMGFRKEHPRPPNDGKGKFSVKTYSSHGGSNMHLVKYLVLACLFMFGLIMALGLSSQPNHLMASVSHASTDYQEYLMELESLQLYGADQESEIARDGPIQTQN